VVRIVAEDRLAGVAANDDVVDRAWVGDPMRAGDAQTLALRRQPDYWPDVLFTVSAQWSFVGMQDLTPGFPRCCER
jgi:hypothetical protein